MKTIISPAELHNRYHELSKFVREKQQPIYITGNGRNATVLLNQDVYERQLAELQFFRLLAESEESINKNNLIDAKLAFSRIRKYFK